MRRYRVDTRFGYVSYSEENYDKALQLYEEEGIRLLECSNIFDEGILLMGDMVIEDRTVEKHNLN